MGGKTTVEASDTAAVAGERVRIFHFPVCDAPPPAVLLDGLVFFGGGICCGF